MSTLWLGVRFVHLPAMALFVGGQLFVALAVVPALRDDREAVSKVPGGATRRCT